MLWSILACGAGYLAGKVFGVEAGFATFFGVLVFGAATTPKVKTPPRNVRVVD
jgi:hypothetical protein